MRCDVAHELIKSTISLTRMSGRSVLKFRSSRGRSNTVARLTSGSLQSLSAKWLRRTPLATLIAQLTSPFEPYALTQRMAQCWNTWRYSLRRAAQLLVRDERQRERCQRCAKWILRRTRRCSDLARSCSAFGLHCSNDSRNRREDDGEPIQQAPAAPCADGECLNGNQHEFNGGANDSCEYPNVE